jgi:uncharacterized protein (DUF3084 family)
MVWALLGLVVLFVGLLVAAIVVTMRMRTRIDTVVAEGVKAIAQRQEAQRQQASLVAENLQLRTFMRELQEELTQMEQEAADAGAHDAAGVAKRLRGRLSESGV